MTQDIIEKALRMGVPIRRIAKEVGVHERTLWRWLDTNPKYRQAYEYYKTLIDNLFSS